MRKTLIKLRCMGHFSQVNMILFLLLFVTVAFVNAQTRAAAYIDPTGSYRMRLNTHKEGEDAYGYYGDMRVKMLTPGRIIIDWDVNIGAPSYNEGGINDTLAYHANKAIFKTSEDSTCKIVFRFFEDRVIVKEKTADYNSGCGFGHGVDGNGIYEKNIETRARNTSSLLREARFSSSLFNPQNQQIQNFVLISI